MAPCKLPTAWAEAVGQPWRFIPCFQAPGSLHMAVDRWLFDQHSAGLQPPSLRFYTWNPVAISLGYHQRHYPDRWNHLTWQGQAVDRVRRPTGGRAVLHQGDLTYAAIASGFTGRRTEVYTQLCQFLIEGWRSLGIDLHYGSAGRGYIHNPNCFGTATAADLVLPSGAKLIGSAQLYRGHAVLQHGSMRLHPDPQLMQQVFGHSSDPLPELPEAIATSPAQIMAALCQAASTCLGADLIPQPLTAAEWDQIKSQNALALSATSTNQGGDGCISPLW